MGDGERGFTLVETVIAVAIAVILLLAGGVWMLSMRPGALRGATNDFDSALAAARQLAATSGNGATLAFVPRTDNGEGFVLSVYAGRPNASNAVTATNIRSVLSGATVNEATYGSPPFSIFLSSAGYPTGKAAYPAIDAHGNASFAVIAAQPACPAGGIVLTFHSPQGATDTRTLKCNVVVAGTAAPDPSPTPNVTHITPNALLAHWTNDRGGGLRFKVAEFGYTQPYTVDASCNAITTWAQNPVTPSAASNPDQPVAPFELYPIPGSPGVCTLGVSDTYGQAVHASVQVMGDLTWLNPQPTPITMHPGDVQTLQFGKTYDNDPQGLGLQTSGCGGAIAVAPAGSSVASSIDTTPSMASITITATAATPGCTLIVGDRYGEPTISIPINVTRPAPMKTWPIAAAYGANGADIASVRVTRDLNLASLLNAALGGGIANAGAPCPAIAYNDTAMTQVDANDNTWGQTLGISTDNRGCFNGALVAYEPGGSATTFGVQGTTCGTSLRTLQWSLTPAISASLGTVAGANPIDRCSITLQDGNNTGQGAPGNGLVTASVTTPCNGTFQKLLGGTCYDFVKWIIYCPGNSLWGTSGGPCIEPNGTNANAPGQVGEWIAYVAFPAEQASSIVQYSDGGVEDCSGFCSGCPL